MKKEKPIHRVKVCWRFEDGSTGEMLLVDMEKQLQRQYHAMANSDDPFLREAGERNLRMSAEEAAAKQFADVQNRARSERPRPASRSAIRSKIQSVMRRYKAENTEFKVFMSAWSKQALDGLRLVAEADGYTVDDENDTAAPKPYTWKTLQKIYSAA